MSKVEVEFEFEIDDLVTLKAMLHPLSEKLGKPQRLSVVFRRVDFAKGNQDVRYYCRALHDDRWVTGYQTFYRGETLVNGLMLLEEVELAAYPEPTEAESPKPPA